MGSLLLSKALVPVAAELHLLEAGVACTVLAVTALFWWGVHSRSFGLICRQAERELLPPSGTAGSASRSPLPHFIVLCISTGAAVHAEPLVAAAEPHLHPAAVACAVLIFAVLLNWAIFCLNFGVPAVGFSNPDHSAFHALAALMRPKSPNPPTAPGAERKGSHPAPAVTQPPITEAQPPRAAAIAAPALHPYQSCLARAALVILSLLISTSWFLEPLAAAAAELHLPGPTVVVTLVVFAACFYTSVHIFCSFFLPRPPAAAAPHWEGIATIAGAGVGIAACLVAAGGSMYGHALARN